MSISLPEMKFRLQLFIFLLFGILDLRAQTQITKFEYEKKQIPAQYNYHNLSGDLILAENQEQVFLINTETKERNGLKINSQVNLASIISIRESNAIIQGNNGKYYFIYFSDDSYHVLDSMDSYRSGIIHDYNEASLSYIKEDQLRRMSEGKVETLHVFDRVISHYRGVFTTNGLDWFLDSDTHFVLNGLNVNYDQTDFSPQRGYQPLLTPSGLYLYTPNVDTIYHARMDSISMEYHLKPHLALEPHFQSIYLNDSLYFSSKSAWYVFKDSVLDNSLPPYPKTFSGIWEWSSDSLSVSINRFSMSIIMGSIERLASSGYSAKKMSLYVSTSLSAYSTIEPFKNTIIDQSPVNYENKYLFSTPAVGTGNLLYVESKPDSLVSFLLTPIKTTRPGQIIASLRNFGYEEYKTNAIISLNLTTLEVDTLLSFHPGIDIYAKYYIFPTIINQSENYLGVNISPDLFLKVSKTQNESVFIRESDSNNYQTRSFLVKEDIITLETEDFLDKYNSMMNRDEKRHFIFMGQDNYYSTGKVRFYDIAKKQIFDISLSGLSSGEFAEIKRFEVLDNKTILFITDSGLSKWSGGETKILFSFNDNLRSRWGLMNGKEILFSYFSGEDKANYKIYKYLPEGVLLEVFSKENKAPHPYFTFTHVGESYLHVSNKDDIDDLFFINDRGDLNQVPTFWQGKSAGFIITPNTIVSHSYEYFGREQQSYWNFNNPNQRFQLTNIWPEIEDSYSARQNSFYSLLRSIYNLGICHISLDNDSIEILSLKIRDYSQFASSGVFQAYDPTGDLYYYWINEKGIQQLNKTQIYPVNVSTILNYKVDKNGVYVFGKLLNEDPQVFFLPFSEAKPATITNTLFQNLGLKKEPLSLSEQNTVSKPFPNPFTKHIKIQLDKPESYTTYRLLNTKGQVILKGDLEKDQNESSNTMTIKPSGNIPQGVYLLELISNAREKKTFRLVKD